MRNGEKERSEISKQARDLHLAFMLADVNPARDSISRVVEKFRRNGMRHLLALTENGGMICLCSDPEMSGRIVEAIHAIDAELEIRPQAKTA